MLVPVDGRILALFWHPTHEVTRCECHIAEPVRHRDDEEDQDKDSRTSKFEVNGVEGGMDNQLLRHWKIGSIP